MSFSRPVVLEGVDLGTAIDLLLSKERVSTTLVVCCPRSLFIQALEKAAVPLRGPPGEISDEADQRNSEDASSPPPKWSIPTLRLLASSRCVKLVFCSSVPHLRAFLSTFALRHAETAQSPTAPPSTERAARTLAVLNLIQLHRNTSAFSAQGLSRTLSTAVEAAAFSETELLFIDCPMDVGETGSPGLAGEHDGLERPIAASEALNPWDEQVSILNVTTKSFGVGDRGWVGRTVKIRHVAARWCVFRQC